MKNLLFILLFLPIFASSQTTSMNYVKTTIFKNTGGTTPVSDVMYFDGLGRPIQQIQAKASPSSNDVITHIEYDRYSRQPKQYLPYATSGIGNSLYDITAKTKTEQFYNIAKYGNTNNPYSEDIYEQSPLNRVIKQGAPGNDWAVMATNDHTVKFDYQTNRANEVLRFKIYFPDPSNTTIPELSIQADPGYYEANQLFKTITKDENWLPSDLKAKTTEEFKDKHGRLILKRTYVKENNVDIPHNTYYVYDIFGNLTYVIPPLAADRIFGIRYVNTGNGLLTPSYYIIKSVEKLCYIYHYDKFNRVIKKQVPDNGWTHIVYDRRNRPFLTQDENQRQKLTQFVNINGRYANDWIFTKYDEFDRVTATGITNYFVEETRPVIQGYIDSQPFSSVVRTTNLIENRDGFPIYYEYLTAGLGIWYKPHTLNYYDTNIPGYQGVEVPASVNGVGQTQVLISKPVGKQTASFMKVFSEDVASNFVITSMTGYDSELRAVWQASNNPYLGTSDVTETLYTFTNEVSRTKRVHKKTGNADISVYNSFNYDVRGRLTTQTEALGSLWSVPITPPKLTVTNTYDNLGRLTTKKLGTTNMFSPYQSVDYTYNVRGWLNGINNPDDIADDLFAFKIGYDGLYNGNISSTLWTNGTSIGGYVYNYDALNRLLGAQSIENTNIILPYSSYSYTKYFEGLSYDKNGNIKTLSRNGLASTTKLGLPLFGAMDALSYTYLQDSNKLLKVTDTETTAGFSDGNTVGNDYSYDANGNMVQDLNKGIGIGATQLITYNHLNLPVDVIKSDTQKVSYVYDAAGNKIEKKFVNGATASTTTTTSYANGFVYKNGVLEYFTHSEGYARREKNGTFTYVCQYKDHLGNVRLSYADANNNGIIDTPTTRIFYDGFESSQGWSSVGAMWGAVLTSYDTSVKKFGKVSGKIAKPTAGELYVHNNTWVPINNTVDTEYIFSGWVYSDNPVVDLFMVGKKAGETEYNTVSYYATTSVKNQWVYLEKRVTVPANIKTLNMRLDNNGGGNVWFDEIVLKKVNAGSVSEVIEETNYYPFGMAQSTGNLFVVNPNTSTNLGQKIKYNGKELQDELGLNMYDYGARNYDPAIGRWFNIDPLAEKRYSNSPYMYCNNNPIIFVDPDGMDFVLTGTAAQDWVRKEQSRLGASEGSGDGNDDHWRLNKSGKLELVKKTNDNFNVFFDENNRKLFQTNKQSADMTSDYWSSHIEEYKSKFKSSFIEIANDQNVYTTMSERANETGFDEKFLSVKSMRDIGNAYIKQGPIASVLDFTVTIPKWAAGFLYANSPPGKMAVTTEGAKTLYKANTGKDLTQDAKSFYNRALESVKQWGSNVKMEINHGLNQVKNGSL